MTVPRGTHQSPSLRELAPNFLASCCFFGGIGGVHYTLEVAMYRLSIDLPDEALAALQVSPEEATQEARRIIAIHWYEQGRISQGTGARIAELSRHNFLIALGEAEVPAMQLGSDERREETSRAVEADREC